MPSSTSAADKLRLAAAAAKVNTANDTSSNDENRSSQLNTTNSSTLRSAVAALKINKPSSPTTSTNNNNERRHTKTNRIRTATLALKFTGATTPWGQYNHLIGKDISTFPNDKLKRHLHARNELAEGTKSELVQRLQNSIEEERQRKIAIELELEAKHRKIADLEERGAVYVCGKNNAGQLGLNDLESRHTFTVIPSTRGKHIQHLSVGGNTVLATTSNHDVYSWGGSGLGPTGVNSTQKAMFKVPQLVDKLNGEEIIKTALGSNHACAVSKGADLFVWGRTDNDTYTSHPQYLDTATATSIACGEMHTVLLTKENEVCSFGLGTNGRLGRDFDKDNQALSLPIQLPIKQSIELIACGSEHSLLTTQSSVFSFGCGDGGRLGLGDTKDRVKPCEIVSFRGSHISSLSAGTWHSAAVVHLTPLDGSGWLYTWGSGFQGQLGQGKICKALTPTLVQDFIDKGLSVKEIFCGSNHNGAITHGGNLYTWGSNKNGALGRSIDNDLPFTPHPGIVAEFGTIVNRIGRGLPLR